MIYWLCPTPKEPSGGVWFIHRLAALASAHGLASLVSLPGGIELVWWDIDPIDPELVMGRPIDLRPGDQIVIPEYLYHELSPQPESVLFIQNHIWLNREYFKSSPCPVLVCSRYLYNWCERELGVTPIGIVRPYLDPLLWRPTPKIANRTLILARRNPKLAHALATAIENAGFSVDFVDEPLSQWELFKCFAESEFYVHHVEPEGFPMICLEAMRSGTIVVGTTGGGGNEFMHNEETALVTPGPLMGRYTDPQIFVDKVLERLIRLREDAALRAKLWTQAFEWSQRYTPESTSAELLAAFLPQLKEAV